MRTTSPSKNAMCCFTILLLETSPGCAAPKNFNERLPECTMVVSNAMYLLRAYSDDTTNVCLHKKTCCQLMDMIRNLPKCNSARQTIFPCCRKRMRPKQSVQSRSFSCEFISDGNSRPMLPVVINQPTDNGSVTRPNKKWFFVRLISISKK